MEYKCWGTVSRDVCIYLNAENAQEAANKAHAAFQRDDDGVDYFEPHTDLDIAIQEKHDGEYCDEVIYTAKAEGK